jgi:endonuclease-3 related protein
MEMTVLKKGKAHQYSQQVSSKGKEDRRALLLKVFDRLYSTFGPQHWWPVDGRYQGGPQDINAAFEVMVGAILTQNTAWTNVEKALENLRSADCLTPETLRKVSTKRLARLLRPSGYFNVKARRVKSFINFLVQQFGGDVRRMLKEDPALLRQKLLSVKGIGPESADSILLYAGGLPWFVVDAYTRRIFSRHGLVADRVSYEDLQDFFMRDLPRDTRLYNEYHALMVKLGKETCRKKPLCEQCPLLAILGEPVFMA